MPEISRFFGIIITMYYETGMHQPRIFTRASGSTVPASPLTRRLCWLAQCPDASNT